MSSSASLSPPDEAAIDRSKVPLTEQPGPRLFFAGLLFGSFSALSTRRALIRRRLQAPQVPISPQTSQSSINPAVQSRQSASNSVLSKGQTSTPSTAQATEGVTAPGYASAATKSAQASAQSSQAAAEVANTAAAELQSSPMVMALEALSLATINVTSWGMVGVGGALWKWDIRSMEEMRRSVRGGLGVDGTGRSEQQVEQELEELVVSVLARKEHKERVREMLKNERGQDREV
ncbi:MAG: hypothetical protein Q9159_004012 [Coniocarpon cinnabarinum]